MSQGSPSRWTTYLNTNRIYCVVPGAKQVWVGTAGGLWVYDRLTREWQHWTPQEGVPGNQVRAIALSEREVWVATADGGAGRYDLQTGAWSYVNLDSGLPTLSLSAVSLAREAVWFGTNGKGIVRYDLVTEQWTAFTVDDNLGSNSITCLTESPAGLWAGTTSGLSLFDYQSARWLTYCPTGSPLSGAVHAVQAGEEGVWAVTDQPGVVRMNLTSQQLQSFGHSNGFGPFQALASEGDLYWLGGANGLVMLDVASQEWREVPEADWSVTALAVDQDFLWVGTRSDGLRVLDRRTGEWQVHRTAEELPENEVLCLAQGQDGIWFGLQRKGVLHFVPSLQRWQHYDPGETPLRGSVRVILPMQGEVWFGTSAGLARWVEKTASWEVYSQETTEGILPSVDIYHGFYEPSEKRLWWATATGVCALELSTRQWVRAGKTEGLAPGVGLPRLYPDLQGFWVLYPRAALYRAVGSRQWTLYRQVFEGSEISAPPGQWLYDLTLDSQSVWFACWDGVRQMERESGQWHLHDSRTGVPLQDVRHVAASRRYLWAATPEGLFRYHRSDRRWSPIGRAEGYTDGTVTAMTYDIPSHQLWIASSVGVSRYDEASNTWTHFGSASGVVTSARSILILPQETWFAGENGVSVYRPDGE